MDRHATHELVHHGVEGRHEVLGADVNAFNAARLVVVLALSRVREHVVCDADLLEQCVRLLVALVLVCGPRIEEPFKTCIL